MSKDDELPRERYGPPLASTTTDRDVPFGSEHDEEELPRRPRLPPLSPSRGILAGPAASLLFSGPQVRSERPTPDSFHYSRSTDAVPLTIPAPSASKLMTRYPQDTTRSSPREEPIRASPLPPDFRERDIRGFFEGRQDPLAASSSSAIPSARSAPTYSSFLPGPSGMSEHRARPNSPRFPFDLPRDPPRQRFDAAPPDQLPSLKAESSDSPPHVTVVPRKIAALLSGAPDSPQDPPASRQLPSIPPPLASGRTISDYKPPTPSPHSLPYSHRTLPPVSVLHAGPPLNAPTDLPDVRGLSEGFETPYHRDSFSTGSSSGPSRVRSPPKTRAGMEPGRRIQSQPPHRYDRDPTLGAEVYLTLAQVSPREDLGSWPEDRIAAYQAGYEDAMRAMEEGIVGVGGTTFPRPRILRHGDVTHPPRDPQLLPSSAFSDSHPRSQRQEYPERPGPPVRGPSYPPHRAERLRNPRDVRRGGDANEFYPSYTWTSEHTSPPQRTYYERSSAAHERDRYTPYPRGVGSSGGSSGAAYYADPSFAYRGSSKPARQLISCYPCRTRKLKCDGEKPCGQCVRRNGEKDCKYADRVRRRGKGKRVTEGGSSGQSEGGDDQEIPSEGDVQMSAVGVKEEGQGLQLELQGGDQPRFREQTGQSTEQSPPHGRKSHGRPTGAEEEHPGLGPPPSTSPTI